MAPEAGATGAEPDSMVVVDGLDALTPSLGRLFVVVGVFDGLHRGHTYLLERLVTEAATRAARPTVITFDHHPDEILIGSAPPLLCDPEERLERLAAAGVGVTVVQTFDLALRMTPYDGFVRMIGDRAPLAGFLMTPDASFGFERGGTVETVTELGRTMGYDVAVVPPFEIDGRPVRSGDIRAAIAAGQLKEAARLLGHDVSVVGRIELVGPLSRVTFDVPVALPPEGEYLATIRPSHDPLADLWIHLATVEPSGSVLLPGTPYPAGERVRVSLPA